VKRAASRSCAALLLAAVLASAACSRRPREEVIPERADLLRSPESWLAEEPVRLLRDYVRIDTSEGQGEQKGAEFLREIFECAGIESEIVCPAPGRCNLLARLPGRQREGALLLLNHIDVAPAPFPEYWKEAPPFEGRIQRGYLYGRGAYDMKSLAVAQALALRGVKERGVVPGSDILFLAEADEELGQRWGARWLLANRPDWFRGVAWVLNEGGTNEMILRDVRLWGIETLQAGYGMAEFDSARPEDLQALAGRWRKVSSGTVAPHPHVTVGFDLLANHLGSPLTDPLRHLDRVRTDPKELAVLPDRYGSFLEPRAYWSPPYPAPEGRSRAYVTLSLPPGMSPAPMLRSITEDARSRGMAVTRAFSSEPTSASPYLDGPGRLVSFVDILQRVTQGHYPGVPFGPVPTAGAYTTSTLFRRNGIPTYGYSPIPMNITDAARRHDLNERVFLRDYVNGVEIFRDILEEFALNSPLSPPAGEIEAVGAPSR
jgi:acetylornithine deacetylase/succinyl-diaminopimelate desuccinylase-like protein